MSSAPTLDPATASTIRNALEAATRGRIDEARRIGEDGLQGGGDVIALNAMLGSLCCRSGDFEAGVKHLRAAHERQIPYLGVCFVRWTRNIGARLKAWRKARGLDQLRAARRIGVCLETVTRLEKTRLETAALEVRGRVFDAITSSPE